MLPFCKVDTVLFLKCNLFCQTYDFVRSVGEKTAADSEVLLWRAPWTDLVHLTAQMSR